MPLKLFFFVNALLLLLLLFDDGGVVVVDVDGVSMAEVLHKMRQHMKGTMKE
jgi:hypothetical protein